MRLGDTVHVSGGDPFDERPGALQHLAVHSHEGGDPGLGVDNPHDGSDLGQVIAPQQEGQGGHILHTGFSSLDNCDMDESPCKDTSLCRASECCDCNTDPLRPILEVCWAGAACECKSPGLGHENSKHMTSKW